jgi:hypothetical protein
MLLRIVIASAMLIAFLVVAAGEPSLSPDLSLQDRARVGNRLFITWGFIGFCVLTGVVPAMISGVIAAQRERGALDLLFTTQLTSAEILWGVLASRVAVLFLAYVSSIPVVILIGLLGGVEAGQLTSVVVITLSSIALVGSVSLYFSTTARSPWAAVVQTYATVLLFWGAAPFLAAAVPHLRSLLLTGRIGLPSARFLYEFLAWTNPPACMLFLLGRAPAGWMSSPFDCWVFAFFASWYFWSRCVRTLRADPAQSLRSTKFGERRFLPHWRMWNPTGDLLDRQPIVWRNLVARVFDPQRRLALAQRIAWLATAVVFAVTWLNNPRQAPARLLGVATVQAIAFHWLLAILASSAVSRERERKTLDGIWLSELRWHELAFGNLHGVFTTLASLGILITVTVGGLGFAASNFTFAVKYLLALAAATLSLAAGAMVISSATRSAATAILSATAATAAQWFLPQMLPSGGVDVRNVAGILGAACSLLAAATFFGKSKYRSPAATALVVCAPWLMIAFFAAMAPNLPVDEVQIQRLLSTVHWAYGVASFGRGDGFYDLWWAGESQTYMSYEPFVAGHLVGAAALLWLAIAWHHRLTGREDE